MKHSREINMKAASQPPFLLHLFSISVFLLFPSPTRILYKVIP